MKFIDNAYYFRKIYFLQITSLDPKFYKPIFFWNIKSAPNYTKKLILIGIATITLCLFDITLISLNLAFWHVILTSKFHQDYHFSYDICLILL
jgi:hypothetical protein